MPEMSGIDLAIAIRRDVPTSKVLLFSGHVDALELTQQAMGHSTAFSTSVSSPLAS
jgi:YesN/AraC family two-component response regulator